MKKGGERSSLEVLSITTFTSNESIVKKHEADEDTVKTREKHKKSVERILHFFTTKHNDGQGISS